MNQAFIGSKLKIERANKHIHDLDTLMKVFIDPESYRLRIKENAETGNNSLKVDFVKVLPPDTALIIGDAVHNLHTALDLMICEAVIDPDRNTKFPFFEKRQELIGAIDSGKIKTAGPEICDLIINTIKPYRGGNDALFGLHDLDIIDKHRRLVVILGVIAITIDAEDENGMLSIQLAARVKPDGSLNTGFGTQKLHIKNYGQPTIDVLFGIGDVFSGESVIKTLHQLSQLVSGIVQTIEKQFIARIAL